jgi:hypothetical protein
LARAKAAAMMHFHEPARDGTLLTELKEFGILTPQVMEKIDRELERPETGTLNEFLLAGADFISEPDWLTWLIRQHECHRFGRALSQDETLAFAPGGPGPEGNPPFRRDAEGHPLVAVLRPDRWEETVARLGGTAPLRAAATLAEVRELQEAWRRSGGGWGTSAPFACPRGS